MFRCYIQARPLEGSRPNIYSIFLSCMTPVKQTPISQALLSTNALVILVPSNLYLCLTLQTIQYRFLMTLFYDQCNVIQSQNYNYNII